MSAAVTTVSKTETETFESQTSDTKTDKPAVENVWMKRSMEKQMAATSGSKEPNQPPPVKPESEDSKPTESTEVKDDKVKNDDASVDDFQKVKGKKDKRERDIVTERSKEDRGKRSEKRELERKDSDKKEKDKKDEKKEDLVKKFDNVNYVEAPLPKTNPWAKNKSPVPNAPTSQPTPEPAGTVSRSIFTKTVPSQQKLTSTFHPKFHMNL